MNYRILIYRRHIACCGCGFESNWEVWMSVCCECCVLSGRGLCEGIDHSSIGVLRVRYDLETS
jgi:hypothetical protein